jgi:hypothetical protein
MAAGCGTRVQGMSDHAHHGQIGRPPATLIHDAQLEIIPGRHAPFFDDPELCGLLINDLLRRDR